MILTLTGNLLAERTFEFATTWQPGKTQRAARTSFQVGGKGINVSKMLNRLGAPNLALCFTGGPSGDECIAWLRAHGFAHHAFATTAPTRPGLVIRAPGQPETTFLGPDTPPDARALAAAAAWLDLQPVTHPLALCGSFPGWLAPSATPLRDAIIRRIPHNNIYIDTYGPPLAWAIEHPVALVKINRHEFDQLCAHADTPELDPLTRDVPARLAAASHRWPVRAWAITDGPGPIWHLTTAPASHAPAAPADTPHSTARVPQSIQPPAIREASPTGSGDVLFAGILHALINRHFTLAEAISTAIPYATANASSYEIAEINKK